jgi:integrase
VHIRLDRAGPRRLLTEHSYRRRVRPGFTIRHPVTVFSLVGGLRGPARVTAAVRLVPRPRAMPCCAGANPKVVQRMLGHASAAMTLDVYADLFESDLDALADRLENVLQAGSS